MRRGTLSRDYRPRDSVRARLTRGQWVRVRSAGQIAATLDAEGKLDGMPFMPEMARCCGQTFRVYRRAVKTCVEGNGLRRLTATVLLEGQRCDGAFHDGCQRNCLYFWKEAWLVPVAFGESRDATSAGEPLAPGGGEPGGACQQEAWPPWAERLQTRVDDRYHCQSTELLGATHRLSRWDITHLLTEIRVGELSVRQFVQILVHTLANRVRERLGLGRLGHLSGTREAPSRGDLGLEAGEWVAIKPVLEIRRTLDASGRNCGLSFEPDMADFATGRFQVDFPIRKIISEQTGQMIPLANTVALKGVTCVGRCSKNCPRNNTLYWREAWLNRIQSELRPVDSEPAPVVALDGTTTGPGRG